MWKNNFVLVFMCQEVCNLWILSQNKNLSKYGLNSLFPRYDINTTERCRVLYSTQRTAATSVSPVSINHLQRAWNNFAGIYIGNRTAILKHFQLHLHSYASRRSEIKWAFALFWHRINKLLSRYRWLSALIWLWYSGVVLGQAEDTSSKCWSGPKVYPPYVSMAGY